MSQKKFVMDMTKSQWERWVIERGFPKFRAGQIALWLSKGVIYTQDMKNIPGEIKTALEEDFLTTEGFFLINEYISKLDGTRKYVFGLADGHCIEAVVMRYKTGLTVCISSQAGCKMGCAFCASSKLGFGRDLSSGEMLAQVLVPASKLGEKISRVVVMGIGEPFDNFPNLVDFLKAVNAPEGPNIGARHITVSTCGLIDQMIEFMCIGMQVNLSVSLHAANDDLRRKLMPIAHKYDLKTLIDTCKRYVKETGRRITFEYALLDGVNDSDRDAEELARLLLGMNCHINLIAANEYPGGDYRKSPQARVSAFQNILESKNLVVTLRREMGADIQAACGQLRRGIQENKK